MSRSIPHSHAKGTLCWSFQHFHEVNLYHYFMVGDFVCILISGICGLYFGVQRYSIFDQTKPSHPPTFFPTQVPAPLHVQTGPPACLPNSSYSGLNN